MQIHKDFRKQENSIEYQLFSHFLKLAIVSF